MKYYFECHITIEPILDSRIDNISKIASNNTFKLAKLLMQKREEATIERSVYDTFMTAHSKDYNTIYTNMFNCIKELKENGYKVWRYKIEEIKCDSRIEDILGVL